MTPQEAQKIDEMPAGPELDALVATGMGWNPLDGTACPYSTSDWRCAGIAIAHFRMRLAPDAGPEGGPPLAWEACTIYRSGLRMLEVWGDGGSPELAVARCAAKCGLLLRRDLEEQQQQQQKPTTKKKQQPDLWS